MLYTMKVNQWMLLGVVAAGLLVAGAGCETERTDQASIDLEPREAELRRGESVTLRASGWHSYHWSLDDNAFGYLSARIGDEITYTSVTTNEAIQLITVSATPSGTNTLDVFTSAIIRHIAAESPVNEPPSHNNQVTNNVQPPDNNLLPDITPSIP